MVRKFVVGDDNEAFFRSAFRRLRQKIEDIEVHYAKTPEGLLKLAEEHPDAEVVTDLHYTEGGAEGYQVLEQLGKERTVYLWTGNAGNPGVRERAMELGAADVIPKDNITRLAGYTEEPKNAETSSENVLILAPEGKEGPVTAALRKVVSTVYCRGRQVSVIPRGELKTVEGTYRHIICVQDASDRGSGKSYVSHEDKYRETPLGYESVTDLFITEAVAGIGKALARL